MREKLILFIIFTLAFCLRIYGLNWDQGQHLHPDERFMTMVATDIRLPKTISEYFDIHHSPLNPTNKNYNFYVYGTFPLLVTRLTGELFKQTQYNSIYTVGRVLSALFDASIIFIIYGIGKLLKLNLRTIVGSLFFYSITILPIQLSHFFITDTFTAFFSTLTIFLFLNFISQKKFLYLILAGFSFGLTLANKISIGITLPLFLLAILIFVFIYKSKNKLTLIKYIIFYEFIFLLLALFAFRIFQPYAFEGLFNISPVFANSISTANQMITGQYDYPPNIQWYNTLPLLHPFLNIFFFGLGPIITLLIIYGIYIELFKSKNKFKLSVLFILVFCAAIFLYQGIQLAKYMRYFYPIYPALVIFASVGFYELKKFSKIKITLIVFIVLNTVFFTHIYSRSHSRVSASLWMCQNLPQRSTVSHESWDDSLPLSISAQCNAANFQSISLPLYDSDTPEKWDKINQQLSNINYLVMSSNRLWGSIPNYPKRYPLSSKFYQDLFDQKLNFKLIKTFYSYPGIPISFIKGCLLIGPTNYPSKTTHNSIIEFDQTCDSPGIYFRDDYAEESFTVYDHPQVVIFQHL